MYLGHCPPFHPKFSPIQPIRVGDPAGSFLSPFVCHFHTFTFDELVRTLKCLLSSPSKLIYMSAQMFFSNPNPHTWGLPGLGSGHITMNLSKASLWIPTLLSTHSSNWLCFMWFLPPCSLSCHKSGHLFLRKISIFLTMLIKKEKINVSNFKTFLEFTALIWGRAPTCLRPQLPADPLAVPGLWQDPPPSGYSTLLLPSLKYFSASSSFYFHFGGGST